MKSSKLILCAAVAVSAILSIGAASAADMAVKAPVYKAPAAAPASSWTGWYIGVNGGGVWGKSDPKVSVVPGGQYAPISGGPDVVAATGSNSFNNSGGLAGGQVGYLWQSAWFVGGIEAAFDWMNAKGSSVNTAGYTQAGSIGRTFTFNNSASTNWLFTLLARAGYDMGGWYPYITGGLAVADLKYSSSFVDSFANPAVGSVSLGQTHTGWAVGGGAEWRLNNHWSLRGEYLYMDIGSLGGTMPVAQSNFPTLITNLNHGVQFRENLVRAAFSYRF
jgi:outer membrane immunogenic protein